MLTLQLVVVAVAYGTMRDYVVVEREQIRTERTGVGRLSPHSENSLLP